MTAAVIKLPNARRFTGKVSQLTVDVYNPTSVSYVLPGPWPQTANVVTAGGTQTWSVSTTGYANVGGVVTGVTVAIDGTVVGQSVLPFNLSGSHTTLPTTLFVTSLNAGSHNFTVSPLNNLSSSAFDTCSLGMMEYPANATVRSGVLQGPWATNSATPVTLNGGQQSWTMSASMYASNSSVTGVAVFVDGVNTANSMLAFNQTGVHVTLPTIMFTTSLAAGNHNIVVAPLNAVSSSSQFDTCSYLINEFNFTGY